MSTQDLSPAEREALNRTLSTVGFVGPARETYILAEEVWLVARDFYSHDFPLNSDPAQIQNADRGLRERGQQILDRLDHTAEDMMIDLDDDEEDQ